jgi:hypothetical protein
MNGFFTQKETESVSRPDGKVYSCTLGANKIKFIGANWQYLAMLRTG